MRQDVAKMIVYLKRDHAVTTVLYTEILLRHVSPQFCNNLPWHKSKV